MKIVTLPPGKLGLGVEFYSNRGGAVITTIHSSCTFSDSVEIGDQLMLIDGKPIFSIKDILAGNGRVRKLGIKPIAMPKAEVDDQIRQMQTQIENTIPKHSADYSVDEPPIRIRQAYNFFTFEMRVKLQEGNFDDDDDIANIPMSRRWNLLSKEQKAPYERMVALDKERYHREMARYMSRMNKRDGLHDENGNNEDGGNPHARKYLPAARKSGGGGRARRKGTEDSDNDDGIQITLSDQQSSGSEAEQNFNDDNDPDWQLKEDRQRKRKRQKLESEALCENPNEKPYQIQRCMSIKKLDRSAIYLETLIRAKTAELQKIKRRKEYLRSIEPVPRIECSFDGCTNKALGGGVCRKHGGTYARRTIICSVQGCSNQARSRGSGPQPAILTNCPKDLWVLWAEYEVGIGGNKPARQFSSAERGRVKFKYSRRKIVWDIIDKMVNAGVTADVAIDRIYAEYGQLPVGKIIKALRNTHKNGGI